MNKKEVIKLLNIRKLYLKELVILKQIKKFHTIRTIFLMYQIYWQFMFIIIYCILTNTIRNFLNF